jgi:hypothetical protein
MLGSYTITNVHILLSDLLTDSVVELARVDDETGFLPGNIAAYVTLGPIQISAYQPLAFQDSNGEHPTKHAFKFSTISHRHNCHGMQSRIASVAALAS